MRIAFITCEVPNAEYSSSTYCALLLIEGLSEAGHEVHAVLPLPRQTQVADAATRRRWLAELSEGGVAVRVMDDQPPARRPDFRARARTDRVRRLVRPRIEDTFPQAALAPAMARELAAIEPDATLMVSYEAVAATDGIDIGPRMAFLGEPVHLPLVHRRRPPFVDRPPNLPRRIVDSLETRGMAATMIQLLRRCEIVALNAAHHADWLRTHGVPQCRYMRYPAPDWGDARPESGHDDTGDGPLRILLLGRVTGSSTLPGLHLVADEILPALERSLDDGFELHVCGGGTLPDALGRKLDHPAVKLRGYVEDVVSEVRAADVFLVPTPLELGARVRITYAWSAGARVVSHTSNARGLPELRDGENALLASDGEGLAAAAARVGREPDLGRVLGAGGRRTWERFFAPPVAAAAVEAELERLLGPARALDLAS